LYVIPLPVISSAIRLQVGVKVDMATKAVEHCDVGTKTGEAIIMLCEVLIESEDAFFAEKVQGCDTAGDASTLIGCNYLVNGKTKMRGWKAATQIHQDLSGVHMVNNDSFRYSLASI